MLKDCLVSQGRAALIPWLQQVLLAARRVKMYPDELEPGGSDAPQEPIPFYYNKANQSIPLVPWNRFQYQGLQTEAFILLLHKLGFQLPADVGKVFPRFGLLRFLSPPSLLLPRIPHFWSADHIYSVAVKLGPVDTKKLKFSLEVMMTMMMTVMVMVMMVVMVIGHEEVEVLFGGVGEDHRGSIALPH